MSWREITLGSAIHVKHGFAFKGELFADHGEFIVLTPGNFNEEGGFRIRPLKDRAYAGDIPEAYVLDESDLIVAMTEQGAGLLGSAALVPQANRYLHNQRLGLVDQIDTSLLDKRFLYLLFNTRSVRAQISGSASGTKVRHTAPERIYRVRVRVPDVNIQASIAETVLAYDGLIENNRRRIQLLEQAARLLYKEWFVHLRFPGHEHVKIKDGVPQGWANGVLSDFYTVLIGLSHPAKIDACFQARSGVQHRIPAPADGRVADYLANSASEWGIMFSGCDNPISTFYTTASGGTPSRKIPDFYTGEVPWVKTQELTGGFILSTEEKITEEAIKSSSAKLFPRHTVLVAMYGATIGQTAILSVPSTTNQACCAVTLKAPGTTYAHAYLLLNHHKADLVGLGQGAAQKNISQQVIKAFKMTLPAKGLLDAFSESVCPLFDQIETLQKANVGLNKARDILLPRLMNGELAA